ncbi:MAG: molybdopterin molybdotransferase MoeA [Planctomycetes bacterium]|nr:molybdopterin molybdotransferase MoeA [Planctomycetota bacterium]
MLDTPEAQKVVLAHAKPLPAVEVSLDDALHRTLARPICCDVDYPPFDRSVMDGYAVRAADVAQAPVTLRLVGQIPAGSTPVSALEPGEAVQINTGAPIPPGADAVVRVEATELIDESTRVVIKTAVKPGKFITPRATYVSADQTVLEAGTWMTPLEIGVAATAGVTRVTVHRRPRVGVLVTGDELIDVGAKLTGARIRNTNEPVLTALVRTAQAQPVPLGIARDNLDSLKQKISEGLKEDVLCVTGGISMGAFDFVPGALKECGVTLHVEKMAIKPGRPVIFGTTDRPTLVFALPGNPLSAFVVFELLVRPALAALMGRAGMVPDLVRAVLRGSLKPTTERRTYRPARACVQEDGRWSVKPLSWHGSGDLFGAATANALIMQPPRTAGAVDGDTVSTILLEGV